jgi:hypothetical protein
MRAHDVGGGKIFAEPQDILHACPLQIHNDYVGGVPGNGVPQLIETAGQIHHPEMVVKGFGQRFRILAVVRQDNYTERFH